MRELEQAASLLTGRRVVALTGAGCSTESGIPDYRGPETQKRAKNPIRFQAFLENQTAQRRYWARSFVGWPRMRASKPNPAHVALAQMEQRGALSALLTQNVDRLHHAAGSRRVVELHGALEEVVCLSCRAIEPRDALQERLRALNPSFGIISPEQLPDGDVELAEVESFQVAGCSACGGALKPNVVFFGENIPAAVRAQAEEHFQEAEALLVVGSSLAVFSGYRFVYHAAKRSLPIVVINLGAMMRGEELASVRIDAKAGELLPRLAQAL